MIKPIGKREVIVTVGIERYKARIMDDGEMVMLSIEELPECWKFQGYAVWHNGELRKAATALPDEVIAPPAARMKVKGW